MTIRWVTRDRLPNNRPRKIRFRGRSEREELGDVLFAVVNLLRFLNRNPEEVLVAAIKKFERRFREVEKVMNAEGRRMTLEEMDAVWEKAKESE